VLSNCIDRSITSILVYGTFGGVYASANVTFNYETIPFNTPLTRRSTGPAWCGQFKVTPKTPTFNLQVSREEPGGFPIFYVGQGYRANAQKNDYLMDTKCAISSNVFFCSQFKFFYS